MGRVSPQLKTRKVLNPSRHKDQSLQPAIGKIFVNYSYNYQPTFFMHILIAEDDQDDQEMIQLALGHINADIAVKMVENGQQALDYLSGLTDEQLPCMTILDMNMPVLNGLQTLELMNAQDRCQQIPKVIFSTSDSADYKARSLAGGAKDYIVKPYSFDELVICLDKMIDNCRDK